MATLPTSYLPTDEEEERQARIAEIASAFGTDLAAGMREGGIETEPTEPAPVDPRAGQNAPIAHGTGRPARSPEIVDPWGESPVPNLRAEAPARPSPTSQAAPPWAREAGIAQARGSVGQTAQAMVSGTQGPGQSQYDREIAEQQRLEAEGDEQARRERRRRNILMGIGGLFAALGGGGAANMFGMGANMVSTQGADQRDRARRTLEQMRERRAAEQAQRQEMIAQLATQRQQQANRDRQFDLEQGRLDEQRRYHDAMLEQRGDQFSLREEQDMKQQARQLEGADSRSRRHANAIRPGAGGRPVDPPDPNAPPPTAQDVDASIERYRAINDMGVREIEAYITRRGVDTTTPEGRVALGRMLDQSRRYLENPDARAAQQFWDNIRSSEGAGRSGSNVDARLEELERRQQNEEAERAIPGWRTRDGVRLRPQDASSLRDLNANFSTTRAAASRIMQLQQQMGWEDFARGAMNQGSETGQEMLRLSRQIQTYLRLADNMGVPTGTEQAQARQQSPEAYSVQNLLSGPEAFRGLMRALALQHRSTMNAWGLEGDRGGQQ